MIKKILEVEVSKFVEHILAEENSHKVIILTACQACGGRNLYKFMNFGPMPKPNIYQTREEVFEHGQISYQLDANLCTDCGLVQLGEIVPSDELFADDYAYRTPDAMKPDFKQGALETIAISHAKKGSKVLEIGSNIGIWLKEFKKLGMKVVGVDPATLYADQANEAGIKTIIEPFTPELAKKIVEEMGKMDVVAAANVLQHIPDIRGTIEGIAIVLAPKGVFTLEFPYLGNILDNTDFDTFYAEHYYYLSLNPLQKMFKSFGLTMVHAKRLPNIHCGSMRIFVKHVPAQMSSELKAMLKEEETLGFLDPKRFTAFSGKVNDIMHQIYEHLHIAKMRGERIVAHGSSAKFVTLTNYGHIGSDYIEYVADSTVAKHGKLTPGMGIPVVSEEKLLKDAPDVIFCGIRNFYVQNEEKYNLIKKRNPKAKILIPIPEVYYR
jgi:methylation protein EvaC